MYRTQASSNDITRYGLQTSFWADGESGYRNFILQAGGNFLNAAKTKAVLDSPETISAVESLSDLVQKDRSLTPPAAWSAIPGFIDGRTAMQTDLVPNYFKLSQEQAKFRWDVAPLPAGKRRAVLGNYVAVSLVNGSRVREAAWQVMKFLIGPETQAILARERQMIPSLRAVANSDVFLSPNKPPFHLRETLANTLPYTHDLQYTPTWSQWCTIAGEEVSAAVSGQKSVVAAMRSATDRINVILASEKSAPR